MECIMLTEMLNLLTALGARASLLALAVFLIRKYWKKLPAGFGYFLSLLPFLRLMAPFFAPVDIPLGTVAENSFPGRLAGEQAAGGVRVFRETPLDAVSFWTDGHLYAGRWAEYLLYGLWAAGVCVLIGRALWRYLKLKRRLKRKAPDPGEAFILGVWRPRVFISPDTPEDLRRHMEEHEKEHLRREDYFVKAAAYALCCIYWFHPLVWLAFRQLSQSMEIACDAGVIRGKSAEERKSYAASVVQAMTIPVQSVSGRMGFTDSFCRRRVEKILEPERMNPAGHFVCLLWAAVFLAAGILTPAFRYQVEWREQTDAYSEYEGMYPRQQEPHRETFQEARLGEPADSIGWPEAPTVFRSEQGAEVRVSLEKGLVVFRFYESGQQDPLTELKIPRVVTDFGEDTYLFLEGDSGPEILYRKTEHTLDVAWMTPDTLNGKYTMQ